MDGPVGAGGPDVPPGTDAPPTGERPRLKLAPRSKPTSGQAPTAAAPAPSSAKKASIFGGGRAHDEFAYEVRCSCEEFKVGRPSTEGDILTYCTSKGRLP